MLYVTTRDNKDAHTAHKALTLTAGPDEGRFVPFRLPEMTADELRSLKEKPFGQIVADILNLFFSTRLTGWDVDCCIGRNPAKLVAMNHKILVAELWHNLEGKYQYLVSGLCRTVSRNVCANKEPTDWFQIAVRIAMLFGLYGEMLKMQHLSEGDCFDISVPTGDFSVPMAAWYSRKMGLPIHMILCTHEENSTVWDLIHRGTFNCAAADKALCSGVERLIHATLGIEMVQSYLDKVQNRQIYTVGEESIKHINGGFFCAVAGKTRANTIINSVFRTNGYLIEPACALLYGGLQDYRAKSGDSRLTVLLSENTPFDHIRQISDAIGIPGDKLFENMELT
jgi:threonine synthase